MDEDEARRLLAEVSRTTADGQEARAAAARAAEARSAAVSAALDAGIPRQQIADAAGVRRNLLYRIASGTY